MAPSFLKKLLRQRNIPVDAACEQSTDGDARARMIDCLFKDLVHTAGAYGSRDSSFGLFHTLGKILYPREGKLDVDPAHLTEPDRPVFHSFLHANYPRHLLDIQLTLSIAESFSWVDTADWRVQQDLFWMPMHSSLPERTISMAVNRVGSKFSKSGFIFLDGPKATGTRAAAVAKNTWI